MQKHLRNSILVTILFIGLSQIIQAQSIISGKVSDPNGEPIIGANVYSKQLQSGDATDLNGVFSIRIGDNDTLEITYLGYRDVQVPLIGQSEIEVTMITNIELLEEVVVTGYGTQKKKDITGATASVGENDFNNGVINSPEQLIRGKVAGVELIQNDGEPGAAFTVRIRGASSIRADNDPLYVIDGYPIDINDIGLAEDNSNRGTKKNALEFLNPEDIASIDILKDASATAIYGARGSNGVVMITTKKGEIGKPRLSYATYFGWAHLPRKIGVLNANQFRIGQAEFGSSDYDYGGDTDWQDQVYRSALIHDHNLSLSGGSEQTQYRASLNFHDQDGIIKTSNYKKYSARVQLQQSALQDRLKLNFNLISSHIRDRRAPGGIVRSTIAQNPTWRTKDEDGNYFQPIPNTVLNDPIASLELFSDVINSSRTIGNLTASFQIWEDLEYKLNVGGDLSEATGKSFSYSPISNRNGKATISNRTQSSNLVEHYLTYTNDFGRLSLTGLGGYSFQEFRNEGSAISREDFPSDNIPLVNNISAGQQLISNISWKEKNALQSFFGRVHLDFQNKYLLTANFRADGSTRFGENNKYGFFPSVALAWRLSSEEFLQNVDYLDDLKLRVSWGLTGNQEIPNKISQPLFGTPNGAQAEIGESDQPVVGYTYTRTANPNLQWEETRQINLGMDISLGLGRWNITVDYFDKSTTDFLLFTQAASAPTGDAWINLDGQILNRGWELALNGHLLRNSDLKWESGITFSTVNNSVNGLSSPLAVGFVNGPGQSGVIAQFITNDAPLGVFYGREWLGFDDDGRDVFRKDAEGNDILGEIGYGLPDFTWGWTNNISYRNWDLSFLFNGAHGHEIFNNSFLASLSKQNFQFGSNTTNDILYSDENINNNLIYSSRHLEDGSFVRLSNVAISYQFPIDKLERLSRLQVYVSGSNLMLWTDYKGYDPEVNIPQSLLNSIPSIGIDWDAYPRSRSFQIGIRTSFL